MFQIITNLRDSLVASLKSYNPNIIYATIPLLATLYAAILFSKWLFDYIYKIWVINKIPGLPMMPFLGNSIQFIVEDGFLNGFLKCVTPFKDKTYCRFWFGTHPWVSLHKADKLNIILESSANIKKSFDYNFLKPWSGNGLVISTGTQWFERRRLITPTFHFGILKEFFITMNDHCEILVENIRKQILNNDTFELLPYISRCTLDIICETAMGKSVDAQNDQNSPFLQATEDLTRIIIKRMMTPWLWPDIIFYNTKYGRSHNKCVDILHNFANEVITERLNDTKISEVSSDKRKYALLDTLIKAHKENPTLMPETGILDEVNTFMFAGRDTTTAAIAWTCYLLARNPNVQNRLYDEILETLGISNRQFTYDEINSMKYLDCVIKESMRICPPSPVIARELVEDIYLDEYRILKGTTVLIFIYQIHRDPRYFPEPDQFNPERFLPESCENIPAYAYIPFSAGKRNCVGKNFALLETKLFVANLVRYFIFQCDQDIDSTKPEAALVLKSLKPIIFKISLR